MRGGIHDVELLGLRGLLLGEEGLDDVVDLGGDLDVVVEEVGLAVVAGLDVVEDVGEEDDLELVEVEDLADQQQQLVGVVPGMLVGGLVQDLVRLVGEPRLQVLLLQLLVGRHPLPQRTHPPKA